MGRIEEDLNQLRAEIEVAEAANKTGRREREEYLASLVGDLLSGEDLSSYEEEDVQSVRASLDRYGGAFRRVTERMSTKGWIFRSNGTWGPDEHASESGDGSG